MLDFLSQFALWIIAGVFALGGLYILLLITFRRVVPTNEVHIVQTAKGTTNYGKGHEAGNVYYEWPTSIPHFGVTKTIFPVSNFDLKLDDYEAFDVDRLPFVVDVLAFFRIHDPEVAAKRVESFPHLMEQLKGIVQSAVRLVMATHGLKDIMKDRSKFGDDFSRQINAQLA